MRQPKDKQNEQVLKKTILLFSVLMTLVCLFLGTSMVLFHRMETRTALNRLKLQEMHALQLQQTVIAGEFNSLFSDLLYLAEENALKVFWDIGDPETLATVGRQYLAFSKSKGLYDQVRCLDDKGMERVRVNYTDGGPEIVPPEALQDKSDRYYYTRSITLHRGEVYISPLDLNVEHGEIEIPYKPVIRLATPVFDSAGEKRGVLVLNYLASMFLKHLNELGAVTRGETMLLNSLGYWLFSPDKKLEWSFMFPERKSVSFASTWPDEWQAMFRQGEGQIETANGLFTFLEVRPVPAHVNTKPDPIDPENSVLAWSPKYPWMLVARIPPAELAGLGGSLMSRIVIFGIGLFGFSIVATWILSLSIVKRRLYQAKLIRMAQFDTLTNLPNRTLFFDRLNMAMEHAKRHEHRTGLLYVDLDGFKTVNDTMGHDAGDELLVKVAEVLRNCSRKTDTVARLGGDEFAVVLFEIKNVEDAKQVAGKIITALCEPMTLKSTTVLIGASIGAAVYPDHADTDEDLVKAADKAMYQAKERGKNNCVAAGE